MNHQLNLNIQTPCTENFNKFSPTAKGGFCNACKQEVIDFTKMNSDEIIDYFKSNSTRNTCGRFYSSQLKTHKTNREKRRFALLTGIGLTCLSFFSIGTIQAQEVKNNKPLNRNKLEVTDSSLQKEFIVKGTIVDESNLPLPGANIVLEGSTIGTTSDFDGNFTFPKKLKNGDVLVVSYIGYNSKKVFVNGKKNGPNIQLQIDMTSDTVLMGKVATKQVYRSKRK